MTHSAITDFRLGLERRLPHAEVSAVHDPATTWSCLVSLGSHHYLVSWKEGQGFQIAGRRIRNVDTAVAAVGEMFSGRKLI